MRIQETFKEDAAEEIIFAFERRYDKGKREGKREGKRDTQRNVLQRLLTQRFGELDPVVTKRIQSASIVELDAMLERVLTATSAEEAVGPAEARRG